MEISKKGRQFRAQTAEPYGQLQKAIIAFFFYSEQYFHGSY